MTVIKVQCRIFSESSRIHSLWTQIAKFMGPTWGPPGSCRPQVGPMLPPWTLLSGKLHQLNPLINDQLSPAVYNFVPTVMKFMTCWERRSLLQVTKLIGVWFSVVINPWIKLIQFDNSEARTLWKGNSTRVNWCLCTRLQYLQKH